MTALLESPVGTLDVSLLEERQPDVPLTCTDKGWGDHDPQCTKRALWEGMCMKCGGIVRRCEEHYGEEAEVSRVRLGDWVFRHVGCLAPFYLAQYVRIGA